MELVSLPENGALNKKKDRFRYILKYKVRWVAHGYKQEKGRDYIEIFAVVVKSIKYKCLFRVEIKCSYQIWNINVFTVFLYSILNKIIYFE